MSRWGWLLTFLVYQGVRRHHEHELGQTQRNENDRSEERSQDNGIAGAGLKHKPATAIQAWAVWDLAGKRWLYEGFW